jgi:hypothetical protein
MLTPTERLVKKYPHSLRSGLARKFFKNTYLGCRASKQENQ